MIVILNSLYINQPGSAIYLTQEIDGLELPSIRTSSGNYAGRDGGYVGGQFYSPRTITLMGEVFSSDVYSLESTRSSLQQALLGNSVSLTVITNAGARYLLYCNLLDFNMPITQGLFSAPFKIELLAADPTIYDNTSGNALTANIAKATGGGYTYPVVYPVIYAAGGLPTAVNNGGTTNVFPIITLTGSMTNPVLTNKTTNLSFSLNGLTTAPGDVVVIDMRQRTVLLNGGNIFGDVAPLSVWWSLAPGSNSILLTTSGTADTVTGVVSWRSGYMGI